jgi:ubiquinone/menaquinone biosynthesis C-methylase UbiE
MPGHKYEAEKAGRLDGRLRRFLMPPEKILGDFTPGPHEIWAEVGAGTGYFAIPLAGMVDKVYALDLSERMLGLLEQNITKSQTGNI